MPADLEGVGLEQSVLVEACVEVDQHAAEEDDYRRDVYYLEQALVGIYRSVVFCVREGVPKARMMGICRK